MPYRHHEASHSHAQTKTWIQPKLSEITSTFFSPLYLLIRRGYGALHVPWRRRLYWFYFFRSTTFFVARSSLLHIAIIPMCRTICRTGQMRWNTFKWQPDPPAYIQFTQIVFFLFTAREPFIRGASRAWAADSAARHVHLCNIFNLVQIQFCLNNYTFWIKQLVSLIRSMKFG